MSPISKRRSAIRRGSKNSMSSNCSPVLKNLIGHPVIARKERATPPRASPSTRVRITPLIFKFSENLLATLKTSCPVIISTTSIVSSGLMIFCVSSSSSILISSIWRRPAVSKISISACFSSVVFRASSAISEKFKFLCSSDWAKTAPGTFWDKIRSCSIAAGRWVSFDASTTLFPFLVKNLASFPAVVVFPAPWRPINKILNGFWEILISSEVPSSSKRWSYTILVTICAGDTDFTMFCPIAFSRTSSINFLATGNETSASSRAIRISRNAASTSSSFNAPLCLNFLKIPDIRSEKESNTIISLIAVWMLS